MQAILFSSSPSECRPLVAGLKSENIFVDVVGANEAEHKKHLLSGAHFLFFHKQIRASDISFMKLVRSLKPTTVTVLLDPASPELMSHVDLAFARPFSYPLISIYVQKKLLEKREQLCPREVQYGPFTLHMRKRALLSGSTCIRLRNKEFALLQYFFMNDGQIVSRSDILEYVWDRNASLSTNTVDVHISRLRSKLKTCDADRYLQTIPCVGYVWSCAAT